MASPSTRILDHIVHLTPSGTLEESVKAFQSLGFTVSPGGTHAGGKTANALVVFEDGTYLELIHFTSPAPADDPNPWAHKQPGWIDFAFLGNSGTPSIAETINTRADVDGSGVHYAAEVRGGRTREDAKVLEWLISAPSEGKRGTQPFFCGDLTPRDWRVPLEPPSNARHNNTARGVAYVKLLVLPEDIATAAKELTSVLGVSPFSSTPEEVAWHLGSQPSPIVSPSKIPVLRLRGAEDEEEREYVRTRGPGIYEVAFVVTDPGPGRPGTKTPYGRVVWAGAGSAGDLAGQ